MRTARVVVLAVAAVAAACGQDPGVTVDAGAAGSPQPAPTVTVTVTETVTAEPEPEPAETVTVTAADSDGDAPADACADLTGGEALAFVFVTSPTVGQPVSSGFDVSGCANTFEATYQWQLLGGDGGVLAEDFGTASCGSGCVGDLAFSVDFDVSERQVGTLRVFSTSAEDGSEVDVNSISLVLEP